MMKLSLSRASLPWLLLLLPAIATLVAGDSTDQLALLSFKSAIAEDTRQSLASWNATNSLCRWQGVTCGRRHVERVTALELGSLGLAGTISPWLGNLTFLRRLHLSNNRLHGPIPPELGRLSRLLYLNLSMNSIGELIPSTLSRCSRLQTVSLKKNMLIGEVPVEFSRCPDLKVLIASSNFLTGTIPGQLTSLSKLLYLDLSENNLTGGIPAGFGNLSSLFALDLSYNQLSGGIPSPLCRLTNLSFLYLFRNGLTGSVPPCIANLSSLWYLNLSYNNLTGTLSAPLGNLSSLILIDVTYNMLSGTIPDSFSGLSSLTTLLFTENAFSGAIPDSLGLLRSLYFLGLSHNKLSGAIPSSLYNLSAITSLGVADNELVGTIPLDIGNTLPNLQKLYMYFNRLHGPIPPSLANASGLLDIELTGNNLTGGIPSNLGRLSGLYWLSLDRNQLDADGWSFLNSLTNCSLLQVLQLDHNRLGGELPRSFGNLSLDLQWVSLAKNGISGTLPADLGRYTELTFLALEQNSLTGTIPSTIGKLSNLQILDLHDNRFSGRIPPTIGNLSQISELYLGGNVLQGNIPASIGGCRSLKHLDLSYNGGLVGRVPEELVGLSSLSRFLGLSHNSLTGPLPSVSRLINLKELDISGNNLSGTIPNSIGECQVLENLFMNGNSFTGSIPLTMDNLKGLQELDLSSNDLSGPVPEFFSGMDSLHYLNLSFNHLEGELPKDGIFQNISLVSVDGNMELCGGNQDFDLPPCSVESHNKKHSSRHIIIIVVSVAAGTALLCVLLSALFLLVRFRVKKRRMETSMAPPVEEQYTKVSYLDLFKATDGFSSSNLIGVGSYGSVYKGTMNFDGERIVAVKVLNLQQHGATKSFLAECEALRNARHRNLVKILTVCSSMDNRGNEFKALVFEYMPNGSLDRCLHPEANEGSPILGLVQKLNIAIDVASALDYLHHHGAVPIAHCDLKPSNVLLDDAMTAHLSDFGLAKFLIRTGSRPSENSSTSIDIKGTIGYVPPEYGVANQVTTQGDIFSYGILLLEIFTGRRPVDERFREGLSLRTYVEKALTESVWDVSDVQLLTAEKHDVDSVCANGLVEECLTSVLRIGLLCSIELPRERMPVRDAINQLLMLKDKMTYKQNGHQMKGKYHSKGEGTSS